MALKMCALLSGPHHDELDGPEGTCSAFWEHRNVLDGHECILLFWEHHNVLDGPKGGHYSQAHRHVELDEPGCDCSAI